MTIFNLGSINADLAYSVPHLPAPGETLAASSLQRGLGGKGANMSVAAARAAARVVHLGAVGPDGGWAVERLLEYGVDTRHIRRVDAPTGHAIVLVEDSGENLIVIHHGANHAIPPELLGQALAMAETGDMLLFQNETLMQREAAEMARKLGLRVAYAAAPFEVQTAVSVIDLVDILVLNAVEMGQLAEALGKAPHELGIGTVIVTEGGEGGVVYERGGPVAGTRFETPRVEVVDTTGAGDTFTGYLLAGLDRGMPLWQAIRLAATAGALMVTRQGTADVIPDLKDVQAARFG